MIERERFLVPTACAQRQAKKRILKPIKSKVLIPVLFSDLRRNEMINSYRFIAINTNIAIIWHAVHINIPRNAIFSSFTTFIFKGVLFLICTKIKLKILKQNEK